MDYPEVESSSNYFVPYSTTSIGDRKRVQNGNSKPREDLREWNTLPFCMAKEFDEKFVNVPLQDLDPFYEQTFVTITKDYRIHRFGASNVLWIFCPLSRIRKYVITIATHPGFAWFIVATVLANFYLLAAQKHSSRGVFEIIFVIIYSLELIIKTLARGFLFDRFSYLKDGWNVLDLVLLVFAFIGIIDGFNDQLAGIRILKLIPNIYELRIAYRFFSDVFSNLFDVTILAVLTLSAFALMGQSMFIGLLTQKCIENYPEGSDVDFNSWSFNRSNWYLDPSSPLDDSYFLCSNISSGPACPEGYTCLSYYGSNPDFGYTSFDSFGWSLLSTIRMFKLDNWEKLYQQLIGTGGHGTFIWFALIMFTCSFYLLALIIGVVAKTISESLEKRKAMSQYVKGDILKRKGLVGTWVSRGMAIVRNGWNKFCKWLPKNEKLQNLVRLIVFSQITAVITKVIIILQILCLCLQHNLEHAVFLGIVMVLFKVMYMVEMMIKIVALGPKQYFMDGWCQFEFLIVVGITLDYLIQAVSPEASHNFLWILRVLVVLRLAQHWPKYERLLKMIITSFTKELGAFFFIIQIFIVALALFGMERYKEHNKYDYPNGEFPRWNFRDFPHSYLIIFRSLCGKWIESVWNMAYAGGGVFLIFVVVVIGNFLTLTFFILLYHHVVSTTLDKENEEVANSNPLTLALTRIWKVLSSIRYRSKWPARVGVVKEVSTLVETSNDLVEQDTNTNCIRAKIIRVTESKYFQFVIVIIIFAASVALIFDNVHAYPKSNGVFIADIIFTVIIIFEIILKLVGLGFWGYFRNRWHWFDAFILITSIVELFQGPGTLRPFQGFRLLMIISRIQSLRVIVETILKVTKGIFGTILACNCLWLCFAVLGVAMLHGKFYKCIDPEFWEVASSSHVKTKMDCLSQNMTWENSEINFDHVPNAFLSLLMVASFKGWIGIMNNAIDSRGTNEQPDREASLEMYIYFILFILIGVFLGLAVVIGEAVIELNKLRKEKLPTFMTGSELFVNAAIQLRASMKPTAVPQPGGKCLTSLHKCITGKTFDVVSATLMFVYLLVLTTEYAKMDDLCYQIYFIVDAIIIVFMTIEALLKIIVLRRYYFSDPVNILDLCVIIISFAGGMFGEVIVKFITVYPRELCIIRATRVVISCLGDHRLGIRTLIMTVKATFSEIMKTSTLLLIVICSYALFGMLQFKTVKLRGALNEMHCFQTFQQSFLVMYEITTGAGWDGVLDGLMNENECELSSPEIPFSDCGNAKMAIPFLFSYLVLCFLITAYMFLTVIQEYFIQNSLAKVDLTKEEIKNFDEVFAQFNSQGSGYVRINQLSDMLDVLKPPFQIKKENECDINEMLRDILVIEGDLVSINDLFALLIKRHYQNIYHQVT